MKLDFEFLVLRPILFEASCVIALISFIIMIFSHMVIALNKLRNSWSGDAIFFHTHPKKYKNQSKKWEIIVVSIKSMKKNALIKNIV